MIYNRVSSRSPFDVDAPLPSRRDVRHEVAADPDPVPTVEQPVNAASQRAAGQVFSYLADEPTVTNNPQASTRKVDIGVTNGQATLTSTDTQSQPLDGGGTQAQSDAISLSAGGDGVTLNNTQTQTTTGAPGNSTSQSATDSVGVDLANQQVVIGASNTQSSTSNGTTDSTTQASQVGLGPDGVSLELSQSSSSSTATSQESSHITAGINTADSSVHVAGSNTAADGSQIQGGGTIGADGASGNLQYNNGNGTTVGGNVAITEDTATVGVTGTHGDINMGASLTLVHDQTQTQIVAPSVANTPGQTQSTPLVVTSTLNQVGVNGNLGGSSGGATLGVNGSYQSGNTVQVFQPAPAGLDPDSDEYKAIVADQTALIESISSPESFDPTLLPEGTGIQMTTFNGWNVGAGLGYGGVSLSGGVGGDSAHDVILTNQNGQLVVTVGRRDGLQTSAGLSALGAGVNTQFRNEDSEQFQFSVDPNNPNAVAELQTFLATGLLPGAGGIQTPEAQESYASFSSARGEIDRINGEIAAIEQQLAGQGGMPSGSADWQQLQELYEQRDEQREVMDESRDDLNGAWQAEYGTTLQDGAAANQPAEGITVTSISDANTQTSSANVALPVLGSIFSTQREQTWAHTQHLNTQGHVANTFSYTGDDSWHFLLWGSEEWQHTDATSDPDAGVSWTMASYNNVQWPDIANLIQQIPSANRDVPDYLLQQNPDGLPGITSVDLSPELLDNVGGYINDPNNAAGQEMWAELGPIASTFLNGGVYCPDPSGYEDMIPMLEGDVQMARHFFLESLEGEDWVAEAFPGLESGPTPDVLESIQDAAEAFAGVTGPETFQALTEEQQRLFILVVQQSMAVQGGLLPAEPYDLIGPISLIEDQTMNANLYRDLFAHADDHDMDQEQDPVWQFIDYAQGLQGNPELYEEVMGSVHFDHRDPHVDELVGHSSEQLHQELGSAYEDEDGREVLNVLQAVNQQSGAVGMVSAITQAGLDPVAVLQQLADDPLKQHLLYDLLMTTSYADDVQAVDVAFD